jgi:hypothetical protein
MKIKSINKVKAISASLVTLAALLTCKQANSYPLGSSYVLPPFAPSNTIVNPYYYPRMITPRLDKPNRENNSQSENPCEVYIPGKPFTRCQLRRLFVEEPYLKERWKKTKCDVNKLGNRSHDYLVMLKEELGCD